jgi:hypothetical protein
VPARPNTINVFVSTPDRAGGGLFFIDEMKDGSLRQTDIDEDMYWLTRQGSRWVASEGSGGFGTYEAVAAFVGSLVRGTAVKLEIKPGRCQ